MCTSRFIRRFVHMRGPHDIFTTRDLLNYGSRSSVDQTTHRLIKEGVIIRLARGVFVKRDWKMTHEFTVLEVAKVKAESFGRKIIMHAKDIAYQLKMLSEGNCEISYATDGASSSFVFGRVKIHFIKTNQRNMQLGETEVGRVIRALLYLGKTLCDRRAIRVALDTLYLRTPTDELKQSNAFMPAWLVSRFNWYSYRSCVWHHAAEEMSLRRLGLKLRGSDPILKHWVQ